MRVFQRLFTNNILKHNKRIKVDPIKGLTPPPSFFRIPYDEQYESRDFIRIKGCINDTNDNNDTNDTNDNKKDTKS